MAGTIGILVKFEVYEPKFHSSTCLDYFLYQGMIEYVRYLFSGTEDAIVKDPLMSFSDNNAVL
jgi:hypothetical protein